MRIPRFLRRLVPVTLVLCAGAVPARALTEFTRQNMNQLRSYALRGYADAQYELGTRYLGQGDQPYDSLQAEVWLKLAAQAGHVRAEADLGKFYSESMDPLVTDLAEAERWLRTASTDGSIEAQYRLQDLLKVKATVPEASEPEPPAASGVAAFPAAVPAAGAKPSAPEPVAAAKAADPITPDQSPGVILWIGGLTGALVGFFLVRLLAGRK